MSEDQSARLGLPYLAAGQLQKHVTLNEALTRLDALVQLRVESASDFSPPEPPPDGVLFILPAGGGVGAWAGFTPGDLLRAESGGWTRVDVPDGALAWVHDEAVVLVRDGGAWSGLGRRLGEIAGLGRFGLGAGPDAANPFIVRLNNALWTAREAGDGGDGDLRLTLNKESPADVLSLLFQSGWSGRAEIGLVGDDDLALKVSDDGAVWREALRVDRASGRIDFAGGAVRREVVVIESDAAWQPPGWARLVEAVLVGGGGGGGAGAFGASGDRFGGGGGGAGGVVCARWPAEAVAGGLTVTVGAGGAGGVDAAGQPGGDTRIDLGPTQLAAAGGGGGGGRGGPVSGVAGAGGLGTPASNAGGASRVSGMAFAGRSLDRPDAPGGGGGGGGFSAAGSARPGGAGGDGGAQAVIAAGGGGGSAAAGLPGVGPGLPLLHWAGGGGGGGSASASGLGHDGGAGGPAGGGGGGGGAGLLGAGAGGPGAGGLVWLTVLG